MGEPCACNTAGSKSNPDKLIMNSWIMFSKGAICRSLLVLRRVDRTGRLNVTGCRLLRVAVPLPPKGQDQNKFQLFF